MRVESNAEPAFDFESQVWQYPKSGPKGISYYRGDLQGAFVDCLLYRDKSRKVRGILNHYPVDFIKEKAGNVNIFVEPRFQHKGIASKLLAEAQRRWTIDLSRQHYTPVGAAFANAYLSRQID